MTADEPRTAPEPETAEERTTRVRETLGSLAFWVVLAYFVLAGMIVVLYFVNGARRRDEALHQGETIADARAKVNQCIAGRPTAVKIDEFIYAVLRFHIAAYENSKATLDATPKNDPQRAVREKNVERIRTTIAPVAATSFPIPTVAQCLERGHTRYGNVGPSVPITKVKIPKQPVIPEEVVR